MVLPRGEVQRNPGSARLSVPSRRCAGGRRRDKAELPLHYLNCLVSNAIGQQLGACAEHGRGALVIAPAMAAGEGVDPVLSAGRGHDLRGPVAGREQLPRRGYSDVRRNAGAEQVSKHEQLIERSRLIGQPDARFVRIGTAMPVRQLLDHGSLCFGHGVALPGRWGRNHGLLPVTGCRALPLAAWSAAAGSARARAAAATLGWLTANSRCRAAPLPSPAASSSYMSAGDSCACAACRKAATLGRLAASACAMAWAMARGAAPRS